MYYNLNTYDPIQKFGHNHLGSQSYGKNKIIHQYDLSEKENNEELDEFINQINNSKISAKISSSEKINITDFLRGRQDNTNITKSPLVYEFAGNHKNNIRKGISPFPQPKHSGPPLGTGGSGQAFKTTGNYKKTGSFFGFSRPHKIISTIEDENIFNLQDMLHPLERSFTRQQNQIKKLLESIIMQAL